MWSTRQWQKLVSKRCRVGAVVRGIDCSLWTVHVLHFTLNPCVLRVKIFLWESRALLQSGQANAAAGSTAAGDDPSNRHPSRLNSLGATGGRTAGISRMTPGDSTPAGHDYASRAPHPEGPTDMHVNSRITADHSAAMRTSLL